MSAAAAANGGYAAYNPMVAAATAAAAAALGMQGLPPQQPCYPYGALPPYGAVPQPQPPLPLHSMAQGGSAAQYAHAHLPPAHQQQPQQPQQHASFVVLALGPELGAEAAEAELASVLVDGPSLQPLAHFHARVAPSAAARREGEGVVSLPTALARWEQWLVALGVHAGGARARCVAVCRVDAELSTQLPRACARAAVLVPPLLSSWVAVVSAFVRAYGWPVGAPIGAPPAFEQVAAAAGVAVPAGALAQAYAAWAVLRQLLADGAALQPSGFAAAHAHGRHAGAQGPPPPHKTSAMPAATTSALPSPPAQRAAPSPSPSPPQPQPQPLPWLSAQQLGSSGLGADGLGACGSAAQAYGGGATTGVQPAPTYACAGGAPPRLPPGSGRAAAGSHQAAAAPALSARPTPAAAPGGRVPHSGAPPSSQWEPDAFLMLGLQGAPPAPRARAARPARAHRSLKALLPRARTALAQA